MTHDDLRPVDGSSFSVRSSAGAEARVRVLAVVFACLLGEPRAEGLTRLDPIDAGRLLGFDRVPEVRTLRRRMAELASLGRADKLIDDLARQRLAAGAEAPAIFYVDGHVRAYRRPRGPEGPRGAHPPGHAR